MSWNKNTHENIPYWAMIYNTNSNSPRAKRWYHIARVIKVDGKWFELYWLDNETVQRGANRQDMRSAAVAANIDLLSGVFHAASYRRHANELIAA